MNIKEMLKTPHYYVDLLLCVIIIVLVNSKSDIKVDPKGFVKNIALNFALTGDGAIILSDSKGKAILTSDKESLENLHTIAITITGNNKNNSITQGLLESLVPSAYAAGKYRMIKSNVDGQPSCIWFNDNSPC